MTIPSFFWSGVHHYLMFQWALVCVSHKQVSVCYCVCWPLSGLSAAPPMMTLPRLHAQFVYTVGGGTSVFGIWVPAVLELKMRRQEKTVIHSDTRRERELKEAILDSSDSSVLLKALWRQQQCNQDHVCSDQREGTLDGLGQLYPCTEGVVATKL